MQNPDADYEYEFDPEAENNTAASIFRMAREGGTRVLDLGSGPGIVASALSQDAGKDVTCADVDADLLEVARRRGVERTVLADLEDPSWVERFPDERFDVIILADVLEHLHDPGQVLRSIHDAGLLESQGFMVISIPNVGHEAIIASLLGGRFDYTATGLLDTTHIRFFTRETFQRLCERHGFVLTRTERTLRTIEQTELFPSREMITSTVREAINRQGLDARTYQYVFRAEPSDSSHLLAQLRERADDERRKRVRETEDVRMELRSLREAHDQRIEDLQQEAQEQTEIFERRIRERDEMIASLNATVAGLREEKSREVEAAREEITQLRKQLSSTNDELAEVRRLYAEVHHLYEEQYEARRSHRREAKELRSKLDEMYASETWRLGRAILWLPRKIKQLGSDGGGSEQSSTQGGVRRVPARLRPEFGLEDDEESRAAYERLSAREVFSQPDAVHVVVAVSTTDLDEGRGDPYTALGLAVALEGLGWEFVLRDPERWYDVPDETDVYLSLLAEPRWMLDPLRVPSDCQLVGWVRNNTTRWVESPTLGLYDALLCSSERTIQEIDQRFGGPTGLLGIGVDASLFGSDRAGDRTGVVSTVNQWGGLRTTYEALSEINIDFPLAIYGKQRELPADLEPFARGQASYFALPSLYRQAAIVLDDQQSVNEPYGNVNSRIYEALAAGALPITSTRAGLRQVGLADLPVYDDPAELHELITTYLQDEERRNALIERLRSEVLTRHAYQARAERFDTFLREEVLGDREASPTSTVLAFQPDYRITNPYQDVLYDAVDDASLLPVDDPRELLTAPRFRGRAGTFHLHWTATILGPADSQGDAERRRSTFLASLDALRDAGWVFIWTVHNIMPHECRFPEVERALRRALAERADAVHVMCPETVNEVGTRYPLPEERVVVIPHGSYVDVYPNVVDQAVARDRLGLGPNEKVFLFFGQVRPYKGLERLLDAFRALRRERLDVRLLVAGAPGRFPGVEELTDRCRDTDGVLARIEEIPDREIQIYFAASDVVVLPHRQVLNSGAVPLAWSFGRPVIAPRTGCIRSLVTQETGLLFESDDDLLDRMRAIDELISETYRRRCFERASDYTYRAMSEDFSALLERLKSPARTLR